MIGQKFEGIESVYKLIEEYDYLHDAEIFTLNYNDITKRLDICFNGLYSFDPVRDWYVERDGEIRLSVHGFIEENPIEREKLVGYSVYSIDFNESGKFALTSNIGSVEGTFASIDAIIQN
jgi:hypothetical protein